MADRETSPRVAPVSGNAQGSPFGHVSPQIDIRTFLSDAPEVTGAEFIRALQKIGRERGLRVMFRAERGKGSHGILYYGDRLTVIKDRRKELSPGLLLAMLKQLGLTRGDLR